MSAQTIESWQDKLRAMLGDDYVPEEEPVAAEPAKAAVQRGKLNIIYERKGRGGKQATIITGFELPDCEVAAVAATLKKRLATGGSARGGEILIQGDRRDDVRRELKAMGYKV